MNNAEKLAVLLFMRDLAIDERMATVLVTAGLLSLEEVAYMPLYEFAAIEGIDQASIPVLRKRARAHLLRIALDDEGLL